MSDDGSDKIRIDKWLWFTRTVKTRTLAQTLVKSGKVRVNTVRVTSPSRTISPDDVLTVTLERAVRVLKVLAVGKRRGPAPEAQLLYEDLTPVVPKAKDPTPRSLPPAQREEGAGRPTKKQRRDMERFRAGSDSGSD